MTQLVPNRLLMNFEITLPYRKTPPAIDGQLSGWSDKERLPDLSQLDGHEAFAPVWACWNEGGLYIATKVTGKRLSPSCDPKVYWKSDNLRLCIDTRDARRNKRATRFCHQFFLMPTGGGKEGQNAVGGSAKIHRAREDAPRYSSEKGENRLLIASSVQRDQYTLEAKIPADCLSGFDPIEHPRIGLFYILEDRELGQQYLTVGDELNWHVDPSTWATAVLAR